MVQKVITIGGNADSLSDNPEAKDLPLSGEITIDYQRNSAISGTLSLDFSSLFPTLLENNGFTSGIGTRSDDTESQTESYGEDIAGILEDEMITDNPEEYLFTVGGKLKQVDSVTATAQEAPYIGHYTVTGNTLSKNRVNDVTQFTGRFKTSGRKFSDSVAKDNLRLEVSVSTDGHKVLYYTSGLYTKKYPVRRSINAALDRQIL